MSAEALQTWQMQVLCTFYKDSKLLLLTRKTTTSKELTSCVAAEFQLMMLTTWMSARGPSWAWAEGVECSHTIILCSTQCLAEICRQEPFVVFVNVNTACAKMLKDCVKYLLYDSQSGVLDITTDVNSPDCVLSV